uniref:NADH-ubiquinone oxidoreductase chain 5 n=1 Tax=Syrbatus sp. 1 RRMO-2024a TaxID=3154167 RepID=A0AAU7LKM8_9COLE
MLIYMFMFFLLSLIMFMMSLNFMINEKVLMLEFMILKLNSNNFIFLMLMDWISLLFMGFVMLISSMIILYSKEYMNKDENMNRFMLLLLLFVISMILLILSPNLISIMLGWDGLGVISYCLVIYYQNNKSSNAGMLTILFNHIGDIALMMMISWMMNYGSWSILYFEKIELQFIFMFMIVASLSKSAQIPFSYWLPMAMAAPTPISSLVHSSTLVTAGVYLLIRFSENFNKNLMLLIFIISLMTMFMASLSANFEYDLKKIIAFSTLSQLGFMMSILSLKEINLVIFHLLMHSLFKAVLFMCAGSMIHNLLNFQDIRYMGSLYKFMPFTCSIFIISSLSLCGLPFMSGFYSKDLMLEFISMNYLNMYMYMIYYISMGLTVSYSFRMFYYLILSEKNIILTKIWESSFMLMSMLLMILLIIMGGSIFMWIMFKTPYFMCLTFFMKMKIFFFMFIGVLVSYEYWNFQMNYKLKFFKMKNFNLFMLNMFNLSFTTLSMNLFILKISMNYLKIEYEWMEYLGGQMFFKKNYLLKIFQFFFINNYKIYLVLLVLLFMFLF